MTTDYIDADISLILTEPETEESFLVIRCESNDFPKGDFYFKMFIGDLDANIARAYANSSTPEEYCERVQRPQTVDLMCNVLDAFADSGNDGSIDITHLKIEDMYEYEDGITFIGRLGLRLQVSATPEYPNGSYVDVEIDARPSDLINISLNRRMYGKGKSNLVVRKTFLARMDDVGDQVQGRTDKSLRELVLMSGQPQ